MLSERIPALCALVLGLVVWDGPSEPKKSKAMAHLIRPESVATGVRATAPFAPRNYFWDGFKWVPAVLAGRTHQGITEEAIKSFATSEFGEFTQTMADALEEIVDANARVDCNQICSAWHFDGENFDGGQNRILALRANIITSLMGKDPIHARRLLGQALHTLQDFYAHTNWVERWGSINFDLGVPGRSFSSVTDR